jgi:hypothetical protein
MKKTIFYLLTLIVCYGTNVNAQVNIGSLSEPHSGAILDLSQTERDLGLLLPRVEILDLKVFKLVNSGTLNFDQIKEAATGMLVYNTKVDKAKNIEEGLYAWDGTQWNFVSENNAGAMKSKDELPAFDYLGNVKSGNALITLDDPYGVEFPGYYTYAVIAGNTYASVTPEGSSDAMFTAAFEENNTAIIRKAIVLVTNPAGKSVTFVLSQDANTLLCSNPGTGNPTITAVQKLGKDGAVYLSINAETGVNYVWTRNNVEVGTGPSLTVTQPGVYTVHAGSIGCAYKSGITIAIDNSKDAPLPVPNVIAGNNGVLCNGAASVTLYAVGLPTAVKNEDIIWFINGVVATGKIGRSVSVDTAGNWFAAVKDGDYYSKPSNSVTVVRNAANDQVTLDDNDVLINGQPIKSFTTFCKGGSLFLSVRNSDINITYKWYNGNEPISQTSPYVIPITQDEIILRVIAIDNMGIRCPIEVGTAVKQIALTASPKPVIKGSSFTCVGTTTTLSIDNTAQTYHWYRNGVEVKTGAENFIEAQSGDYKVYYTESGGCNSEVSDLKTVELQGAPSVDWHLFSSTVIPNGTAYDFSVRSSGYFPATGYNWSYSNLNTSDAAAKVEIVPQGVGQSAEIKFTSTADGSVNIIVTPNNSCGTGSEITKTVKFETGKLPKVQIVPSSSSTYCGGVVFTIMRPANADESREWNNYWKSLSASNIKAVNTSNGSVVSGTFSSDGTNYYYSIPRPFAQITVKLTVSGSVGKEITPTETEGITLQNTDLGSPYTIKGLKCFNINEPGLGDSYTYTYELTGTSAGTIAEVIWTYTSAQGIVNSFTTSGGKEARLKFNAIAGIVTISAYVRVTGGACGTAYYQPNIEVKFQETSCCSGYLAIGGEYERTATALTSFVSAKYNDLVPAYFRSTGKDLCFYKRDVSPGWVNYSTAEVACSLTGGGVDSGDADAAWRLPNSAELAAIQTFVTGAGLNNQPTSAPGTNNMVTQMSEPDGKGKYLQTYTSYWTISEDTSSLGYAYSYVFTLPAGAFWVGTGGTNVFSKSLKQVYSGSDVLRARCVRTIE